MVMKESIVCSGTRRPIGVAANSMLSALLTTRRRVKDGDGVGFAPCLPSAST